MDLAGVGSCVFRAERRMAELMWVLAGGSMVEVGVLRYDCGDRDRAGCVDALRVAVEDEAYHDGCPRVLAREAPGPRWARV